MKKRSIEERLYLLQGIVESLGYYIACASDPSQEVNSLNHTQMFRLTDLAKDELNFLLDSLKIKAPNAGTFEAGRDENV